MIPDYDRLYRLHSAGRRGALHLARAAPFAPGYEEGVLRGAIAPPVPLERVEGRRVGDFVRVGVFTWLLSGAAVAALDAAGATGWRVEELGGYAGLSPDLAGHGRLVVTGSAGAGDVTRSERVRDSDGARIFRGLRFAGDAWDGSDFVVLDGSTRVVVTEGVVSALREAKISDIEFERLADLESPDYGD